MLIIYSLTKVCADGIRSEYRVRGKIHMCSLLQLLLMTISEDVLVGFEQFKVFRSGQRVYYRLLNVRWRWDIFLFSM